MVIVADSSLQLAYDTIKELDIRIVEYPLFVNGQPYPVSMSMSGEEKEKLRLIIKDKNNNVSTSGLKEEDLKQLFEGFKDQKILTIPSLIKTPVENINKLICITHCIWRFVNVKL